MEEQNRVQNQTELGSDPFGLGEPPVIDIDAVFAYIDAMPKIGAPVSVKRPA